MCVCVSPLFIFLSKSFFLFIFLCVVLFFISPLPFFTLFFYLGPVSEIQGEHGATYVLLKKNEECEEFFFGAGRRQKKTKKGRKFSAVSFFVKWIDLALSHAL